MDRETRKYWQAQRRQMLKRDRRQRFNLGQDMVVTKVLIGLMVLSYLVENFVPGLMAALYAHPGGIVLSYLLSALSPGGFIGLLFAGFFLWIIGSQIEGLTTWWQYLVIFFASGVIGAFAAGVLGGGSIGGTFASFGLAGAYVMVMASRRMEGATQWAILLLGINVVLSGFQPGVLGGMLAAFFAGLILSRVMRI